MKVAAHGNRIFLDEFELSGFLNSTEQMVEQEVPVTTCFGDAGPRRAVGNYEVSHNDLGLFDGDDDAVDEILHALVEDSGDHYLTKLWGASAEASVAYDNIVKLATKPLTAERGGVVMLNHTSQGAGGISRGLVLANATVSAAGERTGQNVGAKSSGPLYRVIFRLLALASGSITITVQESQNDGDPDAYANVSGLTSGALSAAGVVMAETTAALEAWRRVAYTGTFSGAVILVTAGIVAGTG